MSEVPNIPEGKKIVKRTLDDGSVEWKLVDDDCWVATAFYGDAYHPKVVLLRSFRNALLTTKTLGSTVSGMNRLYYTIGRTKFGKWWSKGLNRNQGVFRKLISKVLLSLLFVIATKYGEN